MGTSERNLTLRRQGKLPKGKIIKKKYPLKTLDLFASYVLSNNRNITKQGLLNMRSLIELLDMSLYLTNQEEMDRIDLIRRALNARIDYNLANRDMIMCHVNGGLFLENNLNVTPIEISNEEVDWVDENISSVLKYMKILDYSDEMIEIGTKIKSGQISTSLIDKFETFLNNAGSDLKTVGVDRADFNKFSLKESTFNSSVTHMYSKVTSDSNKLKTGMTGLNALLKGGFEKSRVYLLVGVTGGGKSITLLNIAYQIKKYNKKIELKDPTKKPAIIYMTMENNLNETIERLFTISTGGLSVADYTLDDVLMMMGKALEIDDENAVDLLMEYVPADGCTTQEIENMINRYEDSGYEIICFIQDHIKKLRSWDHRNKSDLRIELGDIINEMKVIAAKYDIPIITNSHLNRDANRKVEESMMANRVDIVRCINRENIGESLLMLDNTDVSLALANEITPSNEKYMGVRLLKSRGGTGLHSDVIFLPFEDRDSIKFVEDTNKSIASFKYTLGESNNQQPIVSTGRDNIKVSQYSINSITELNKSLQTNNIYEFNDEE